MSSVIVVTVLVTAMGVLAHPGPQLREGGGGHRQVTEPVTTQEGQVTGVRNAGGTVDIFAGIPYAQPPVGELRWREPRPPLPRSGVFAADRFSPAPIQGTSSFLSRALSRVVELPLESTLQNPYPVSEDSLTLNVWRPSAPVSALRPVLVYLPGGGFATGSGALPLYDGEALAARGDLLTVTVNYRLGVFGFLSHPELAAESGYDASGNYGILDQLAALEWVQENIAALGGDPERVTVAGESAGGASACIIGATPLAKGLVNGIIGGSGTCMGTTGDTERGDQNDDRATAEAVGRRLSAVLGDATIAELRDMPADRIRDAAADLSSHWRPSIDGRVLDRSPIAIYASGEHLDVPLLTGNNADESSLALASPPDDDVSAYLTEIRDQHGDAADDYLRLYPSGDAEEVLESRLRAETDKVMTRGHQMWAELAGPADRQPSWLYFFTRTPPDPQLERYGAYHGAEIGYAFDTLDAVGDLRPTRSDLRLRDEMTGHWIAFVRTGNPNAEGLPRWSSVRDSPSRVMRFGSQESAMAPRPRASAIDFWLDYTGPVP